MKAFADQLAREAARWVEEQRERFRPGAKALSAAERTALREFFPDDLLDSVLVCEVPRIENPEFYTRFAAQMPADTPLIDLGEMAGITLRDTVLVATSRAGSTERISLLFHEMVHAVQYRLLGVDGFLRRYVAGWIAGGLRYESIPLEADAYQLQARFDHNREEVFPVAEEVERQLGTETSIGRDPVTLSIDIGGTNTKAGRLDPDGELVGEAVQCPTSRPATPEAVVEAAAQLAQTLPAFRRASVGFPGVVVDGRVLTAHNFDGDWLEFPLQGELSRRLEVPVRAANDADIQGFGAIQGHGVELVLTLGTGLGSALFVDGTLVPNLELPHHPFRGGETYEEHLGLRRLRGGGEAQWKERLQEAIDQLRRLFSFRRLYLGGGNSRLVDFELPPDVEVVSNEAGLRGGIALWR